MAKILIINQSTGVMIESLTDELKKENFDVMLVPPDIISVGTEQFDTDVFIIYAGEYVSSSADVLSVLRDYCREEEKPICVVGYENDIAAVEQIIPPHTIACRFIRPFDVRIVADKIHKLLEADPTANEKRSILLVDDDVVFLKTALKFLSGRYTVTAVRAGHHALKYLADHRPDLVLLDYEMPMMSGAETLEKIRANPATADIPVVFLTGAGDKQTVLKLMQMKPDGYILKKSGKEELVGAVRNYFLSHKWRNIDL